MDNILANPAALTPLALIGLVAVQVLQLVGNQLKAKSDAASHRDESMAGILQKILDQHTASMERQAAALERISASMAEVQAHMHATNAVLNSFTHRLEAVELKLAAGMAAADSPTLMRGDPRRSASGGGAA